MANTTLARPAVIRPSNRSGRVRHVRNRPNWGGGIMSVVWLVIILVPIYYIVITSISKPGEFYTRNPLAPPTDPTLDSYSLVLQSGFPLYLLNSILVTVGAVALTVVFCVPAAFVIVRSRRRLVRVTYSLFLLGLAVPLQATIVPLFFMFNVIGLYDTLWAIILPSAAFAIPITILVLVNFLRDIPGELFESMRVEGATNGQILRQLVIPLARPAIATVIIYDALQSWNGFLLPLVLTQSDSDRTLPLGLSNFQGLFGVNVPATLAAVVLSAIPILALYILARRQLISGLTAGIGK
jgi:raffinose/stachyose/melibiose transport system permease protein